MKVRHLILILGDQLDPEHSALAAADASQDRILMIEAVSESTHVASHKQRTVLFLSAMRHYAQSLRDDGWQLDYHTLSNKVRSLSEGLSQSIERYRPDAVQLVQPGDWRVLQSLRDTCEAASCDLHELTDTHFYTTPDDFAAWARGRKQLTMEYFYREQRKRFGILMEAGQPAGGAWNFDKDNRKTFGKKGPGMLPAPQRFAPDETTRNVIADVEAWFPTNPGAMDNFGWPVTRAQALEALDDFITYRLADYGRYQDAMWQGEAFLYHALIASAMNLKLINPREAIDAAISAWQAEPERYPIAAVEGFVRQILGWREFIRGIYWQHMPDYKTLNHYGHDAPLPDWFWSGDTSMNCLRQSVTDTLQNAYAHHIQRLMVIGNYAVLAGLEPMAVCNWYLSVYVDAVEWVELPNTLGMALHGDGGIVGSKPYVASGAYINRMSNYCGDCRFSVSQRTGTNACPFNALYWDFMIRHRASLASSPRMRMVLKNIDRWDDDELAAIQAAANDHRQQ
ncbi:MAG: cryptochrome/photolyase family protein [Pseudomonadota bacterium]